MSLRRTVRLISSPSGDLVGGSGRDELNGGSDDDDLYGGGARDTLPRSQ